MLNNKSVFSDTISIFALASIPRMMIAPRRCAFGIALFVTPEKFSDYDG